MQTRSLNVDFLQGSLLKSIIVFSIPLLISSVFQHLYNTIDIMIVGHMVGDAALAAIGAVSPIYDLMVGFALGIGNGLSIVVARGYGSRNQERLLKCVASAVVVGILVALAITVVTLISIDPLLRLLNTPEEIMPGAKAYGYTITAFTIMTVGYNLCSGILRAVGNSLMPMVFLVVSSVLNIVLDILLVGSMGVAGAALATVLAQGVSVLLCILYIARCCPELVPFRRHYALDLPLYSEMLGQGIAMGMMHSIVAGGTLILQGGINGLGYLTIAGHTAVRRIFGFSFMPQSAVGASMTTLVSQNMSAGQYERIRKAVRQGLLLSLTVTVVLSVVVAMIAPQLTALISGSTEPVVIDNGTIYLRVGAPFFLVLAVLNIMRNTLAGLGEKTLTVISSVIELIGKILFVALLIPRFKYMAVVFCEPIIWCAMTVYLVASYMCSPVMKRGLQAEKERTQA